MNAKEAAKILIFITLAMNILLGSAVFWVKTFDASCASGQVK